MTPHRVFVVGATGTSGRAAVAALIAAGHDVVCLVRSACDLPAGATVRLGDPTAAASIAHDGLRGERFDTVLSCLASRTGATRDVWAIDYAAHRALLEVGRAADIGHYILVSAICVQRPRLAFHAAKLQFEAELMASDMAWTIVRPTAYFKSLSGQVGRVRSGKRYLLFGDGRLTSCKPISDADLGRYLAECVTDPSRRGQVLPIGGPGPALTPRDQGEALFALLGRTPQFRSVPVALLDLIVGLLTRVGHFLPSVADKAELARIGRYYATESMLVWDAGRNRYDADATPSTGSDHLFDHYQRLLGGEAFANRGDAT